MIATIHHLSITIANLNSDSVDQLCDSLHIPRNQWQDVEYKDSLSLKYAFKGCNESAYIRLGVIATPCNPFATLTANHNQPIGDFQMIAHKEDYLTSAAITACDSILFTLQTYANKQATAKTPADKLEITQQALSSCGQQALMLRKCL